MVVEGQGQGKGGGNVSRWKLCRQSRGSGENHSPSHTQTTTLYAVASSIRWPAWSGFGCTTAADASVYVLVNCCTCVCVEQITRCRPRCDCTLPLPLGKPSEGGREGSATFISLLHRGEGERESNGGKGLLIMLLRRDPALSLSARRCCTNTDGHMETELVNVAGTACGVGWCSVQFRFYVRVSIKKPHTHRIKCFTNKRTVKVCCLEFVAYKYFC